MKSESYIVFLIRKGTGLAGDYWDGRKWVIRPYEAKCYGTYTQALGVMTRHSGWPASVEAVECSLEVRGM